MKFFWKKISNQRNLLNRHVKNTPDTIMKIIRIITSERVINIGDNQTQLEKENKSTNYPITL
jgi:hypothetical protein